MKYYCDKIKTNILAKVSFCGESFVNCTGCKHKVPTKEDVKIPVKKIAITYECPESNLPISTFINIDEIWHNIEPSEFGTHCNTIIDVNCTICKKFHSIKIA